MGTARISAGCSAATRPAYPQIGDASVLSAHAWAVIGLVLLPLLIWVPLWLGDAAREPRNEIAQEQPGEPDDDEDTLMAA